MTFRPQTTALPRAAFAALIAVAWSAITLAALGHFHTGLCLGAGACAFLVVLFIAPGRRFDRLDLAALGAALVLFVLAGPPDERILGGWDPGVYLHTSAMVERTGGLRWNLEAFSSLTALERTAITRDMYGVVEPFGGMYVLPDGRTAPTFFHLYPCLLAVAQGLGGLRAALWVNPLLGALSVLAFFAFVSRLLDRRWAAVAAWLFALNPAMIWQAGFPTAEMLTQVLLLGGLALAADAFRDEDRTAAAVGGAGLGLALLCRYDTILFLAPWLSLVLMAMTLRPKRGAAWIVIALVALLAAQAVLHQRFVTPYYHPVSGLLSRFGAALAGALAAALVLLNVKALGVRAFIERIAPALRIARAALVLLFFAWAWWVRPGMADRPPPIGGPEAGNMFHLSALFGPVGLAAALTGVAVLLLRGHDTWRRAWVFAAVAGTGLLIINIFNDQFLMLLARRFIPVSIPLLVAGQAALLQVLAQRLPAGRQMLAGAVAALVLLGLNAGGIAGCARSQDWPGLVAWCRQVSAAIPREAAVYVDQPGFAAPLRFLFERDAFELHARTADRRVQLAEVMHHRLAAGRDVWLLTMAGPLADRALLCEEKGRFPLDSRERRTAKGAMPVGWKSRGGDFTLYHVRAAPP